MPDSLQMLPNRLDPDNFNVGMYGSYMQAETKMGGINLGLSGYGECKEPLACTAAPLARSPGFRIFLCGNLFGRGDERRTLRKSVFHFCESANEQWQRAVTRSPCRACTCDHRLAERVGFR